MEAGLDLKRNIVDILNTPVLTSDESIWREAIDAYFGATGTMGGNGNLTRASLLPSAQR